MRRFLGWSLALGGLVVTQAVVFPGMAHASGSVYRTATTLTVLAASGHVNNILIARHPTDARLVRITDRGDDTLSPGARCEQVVNDNFSVDCERAGIERVVVNLRDRDDELFSRIPGIGEFQAGAGDDLIDGGPGNDRLEGQAGDDVLIGRAGADVHLGGDGNDTLRANDGQPNDTLDGGPGSDRCVADPGDIVINCER